MSPPERSAQPVTILMADDDEEDRELTRDALQDARLTNEMRFVVDGQDLMDYLRRRGATPIPQVDAPRPGIILLDLNMPQKDGREALAEIKADEDAAPYSGGRPDHFQGRRGRALGPTTWASTRSSPSRSRSPDWSR